MPRAAAKEAKNAASTAGNRASETFNPLFKGAQEEANSQGFDPGAMSAITNASIGGVNSAFGDAAGQVNRSAAINKNQSGVAGDLDKLALEKGIAGGDAAGQVQIANQQFKAQQRQAGLNLLNSQYGTNTNAQTGEIKNQIDASPGWAQTLQGVLTGVRSLVNPKVGK